jgi:hypothetical protein
LIRSHAAWIGVLQDGNRRLNKFTDEPGGSVDIDNIVIGKFFPVQLLKIVAKTTVKGGTLMRIFPVA